MKSGVLKKRPWLKISLPFRESALVVTGLVSVGLILQVFLGSFQLSWIHFPVNAVCVLVLILMACWATFGSSKKWKQQLSGLPLSTTLIATLLLFSLLTGLIPQTETTNDLHGGEGPLRMVFSWSFVLVYALTTLNLSCVLARRLRGFKWKDHGFYLNHLGLLLLLLAAGFGSADRQKGLMQVLEGGTENRAYDEEGWVQELPFSLQLNDFCIEEYAPDSSDKSMPRLFRSEVTVLARNGKKRSCAIEVNKPLRAEGWMVYQYGYDEPKGNDSAYSVFQCVRDPWLPVAYVGIALFMAGALSLLWKGNKRRKEETA